MLAISPSGHTRRVKLDALGRFSLRLTQTNVDRSSAANPGSNAGFFSTLYAGFDQALNASAGSDVDQRRQRVGRWVCSRG